MYGRPISCCFSGHRPEKLPWKDDENDPRCKELKQRIHDAVSSAISDGFTHFLCGMARGCDMFFAEEVLYQKSLCPDISLEAVIPCLSQTDGWRREEVERYRRILSKANIETVVQEEYSRGCMQRRNRYMVDHAALLIAVNNGEPGGTRNTILYAMRQGLNIADISI